MCLINTPCLDLQILNNKKNTTFVVFVFVCQLGLVLSYYIKECLSTCQ